MTEVQLKKRMKRPTKLPYVIKRLKKVGVIKSKPNLKDMRRVYYGIDRDILEELQEAGIR